MQSWQGRPRDPSVARVKFAKLLRACAVEWPPGERGLEALAWRLGPQPTLWFASGGGYSATEKFNRFWVEAGHQLFLGRLDLHGAVISHQLAASTCQLRKGG